MEQAGIVSHFIKGFLPRSAKLKIFFRDPAKITG
jgi:hypothetical protein